MNINKNQFEILTYIERKKEQIIVKNQIANDIKIPVGIFNKSLTELISLGAIKIKENKEINISDIGLEILNPYRVKRAIILAAGFGSRMVPITLNTPKPLVRVHGKMIIETILDAIVKAEIQEIVIVRGYLWEQFDLLKHKYPHIKFLHNPIYNESNNISSALLVKDILQNSYVLDSDLLLSNQDLIRKYEFASNYLGMYKEYTDDWCYTVKKGYIKNLSIGGTNCYHMYGISYWSKEDGLKLSKCIEHVFKMPGGKERFWDEVSLRVFDKEFNVAVRPCFEGDILEIDTFNELKQVDSIYNV